MPSLVDAGAPSLSFVVPLYHRVATIAGVASLARRAGNRLAGRATLAAGVLCVVFLIAFAPDGRQRLSCRLRRCVILWRILRTDFQWPLSEPSQ